ncbi:Uncharacterised protein [Yersinia enterocolitica]|nr:hypothetical protein FORC066_3943 [Yersinia enterocolitica]CQR22929.1 Uncharacterised protein [Yersinia enterocolitica]
MSAPKPPVALPNVAGNENIPAPIIEPTTKEVRAGKDNLFVDELAMMFSMTLDKLS